MRYVLATALVFAAAAPAAATTFISGGVDVGARAVLGTMSDVDVNGSVVVSTPDSAAASAVAGVSDGTYSVTSFVSSAASWASADAGSLRISWGWNVLAGGSGDYTLAETNQAATNWQYTFTATGNGTFDANYSINGFNDKFGLQPLYGTADLPFGPYGGTVADPTGSGSFSVALVNGQTYTIALFNFGNLSSASGFDANGDAGANVDWTINYTGGVPEPASWAMMIAGFGMIGTAARRRRNAVTA